MMSLLSRASGAAVAALVVALLPLGSTASADPALSKPAEVFRYQGTFTADLKSSMSWGYGSDQPGKSASSAKISGTVNDIRIVNRYVVGGISGSLKLISGEASRNQVLAQGSATNNCDGTGLTGTYGPHLARSGNKLRLQMFDRLSIPMTCTYSETGEVGPGFLDLPPIPVNVPVPARRIGDETITIKFSAKQGSLLDPDSGPGGCPDRDKGDASGIDCEYTAVGSLVLTKVSGPKGSDGSKNDKRVEKPKNADIAANGRTTTMTLECTVRCQAVVVLYPLTGDTTLPLTARPVKLKAKTPTKVVIPLDPNARTLTQQSGGQRAIVTYSLPGGKKVTTTVKIKA